jgi:hypothetical protein
MTISCCSRYDVSRPGGGIDLKPYMNGLKRYIGPLKRYIGPGLVISVLVHVAPLLGGVLFVGASALHPLPPEAMEVEVVKLKDFPGFGTTTSSPADGQAPVTQGPLPKPRAEPQQQDPTKDKQGSDAAAAQHLPAPEAPQADLARAEKSEHEKQDQSAEAPPAPPQPTESTPEQPSIAQMVSEYTTQGGPLGGLGNEAGEDFTLPFRERLISCSKSPTSIEPGEKVFTRIRISFNRDGSLSSPPRLLVPAPSAKQRALMASVVDALESCQPFTMLPPDKYNLWKTLVWYVFPVSAFARAQ